MNFINAFIYKPNRELFYVETTQKDIDNFYNGTLPNRLMELNGAFGTYDFPGLFIIKKEDIELQVLGIEYRPNDDRIDYPTDLKSIFLPGNFVNSDTTIDGGTFDEKIVNDYVIKQTKDAASVEFFNGTIISKQNPKVVQVYVMNNHNRIMIDADYKEESQEIETEMLSTDYENELYKKVYKDPITGHYNWTYLWPILTGYGLKGIQDYAFVHFNVKDFKAINLVYGHDVANDALKTIVGQMDKQDWVYHSARCDNDNFAMMIKDMPREEMTKKLKDFFETISFLKADPSYKIYYRCGVVPMRIAVSMGNRVGDAGKQAQSFGNRQYETEIIYYTDEMQNEQEWSAGIRAYLDTAIAKDEFVIYLQPKYDIENEKLHGAEALIRWNYKNNGLLSPFKFVPLFETGGLINKLDDIVLNKVCALLKKWREEGRELFPISVNVSRKSIGIPNLVEHLTSIVDSYDIAHEFIDFELTESAAYDNQENMIEIIKELKSRGFLTSMDDFGTGFSSLSTLAKMPFDTIKIDKSFVDGIGRTAESEKDCGVIKHIISMGKELKLTCLAEGAEDREQVELLKEFGCEVVQGYYFDRPLPIVEFENKYLKLSGG